MLQKALSRNKPVIMQKVVLDLRHYNVVMKFSCLGTTPQYLAIAGVRPDKILFRRTTNGLIALKYKLYLLRNVSSKSKTVV